MYLQAVGGIILVGEGCIHVLCHNGMCAQGLCAITINIWNAFDINMIQGALHGLDQSAFSIVLQLVACLHVVREPAGTFQQGDGFLLRKVVQAAVERPVREEMLEGLLALGTRRLLPM